MHKKDERIEWVDEWRVSHLVIWMTNIGLIFEWRDVYDGWIKDEWTDEFMN